MNIRPTDQPKPCCMCHELKPHSEFHWQNRAQGRRTAVCKACESLRCTIRSRKLKLAVVEHYSGGKNCCAVCGESDLRVLSIDHIDGGGNEHRRSVFGKNAGGGGQRMYDHLRKTWPEGLQVLCMNCQFIKRADNREYMVFDHLDWM